MLVRFHASTLWRSNHAAGAKRKMPGVRGQRARSSGSTDDGIVNDPGEVGGYPEYSFSPDEVPADADHDGMPDEWEKKYDLNSHEPTDGRADADGDGYTNVEECLNGTSPREKIDYRNLGKNVDRIS